MVKFLIFSEIKEVRYVFRRLVFKTTTGEKLKWSTKRLIKKWIREHRQFCIDLKKEVILDFENDHPLSAAEIDKRLKEEDPEVRFSGGQFLLVFQNFTIIIEQ